MPNQTRWHGPGRIQRPDLGLPVDRIDTPRQTWAGPRASHKATPGPVTTRTPTKMSDRK